LSDDELTAAGITGGTIRLSVGLESLDDLIWDLEQGLRAATHSADANGIADTRGPARVGIDDAHTRKPKQSQVAAPDAAPMAAQVSAHDGGSKGASAPLHASVDPERAQRADQSEPLTPEVAE
jgi:Cys/Met metabolism PLP-dependent enzyme